MFKNGSHHLSDALDIFRQAKTKLEEAIKHHDREHSLLVARTHQVVCEKETARKAHAKISEILGE